MQFHFTETMRGRVEEVDGTLLPFEFTIKPYASGLVAFLLGDPLKVGGTASLKGIAERVPVGGTLLLAMPLRRRLCYDLSFRGLDGALYRYVGRKDVRYMHFVRTMTWLRGTLFRNGESVGSAELWFDLRDLPGFVLSFRPGSVPGTVHG